MQTCKKLVYLFTVLLVIGFTGTAYAAFEVTASTDVQTIPATKCDQAGSYTMTMATGFQMREGDVITYNLTSSGGAVSLCKTVNYFLALTNDGSMNLTADNSYPVYSTVAGDDLFFTTDAGASMDAATNLLFGFLIQGTSGSSALTLTARCLELDSGGNLRTIPANPNAMFMTYTPGLSTSKLTIALFDEKFNQWDNNGSAGAGGGNDEPGFRKLDVTATAAADISDYDVNIAAEDNTLCIDTSAVSGSSVFVEASPQSTPSETQYKLNFTGTYRIALVQGALAYTAAALGKATCLPVTTAATVDQLGNVASRPESFSPGVFTDKAGWTAVTPVCSALGYGRGILVSKGSSMAAGDKYRVTLTVMAMAAGGTSYASTSKAWFKSTGAVDATMWTQANNSRNSAVTTAGFTPPSAGATYSTIGTTGEFTVDPPTVTEANYTGYHTLRSDWLTVSNNCGTAANQAPDSLMIDIGNIWFDYNNISEGETIGVRVAVEKFPCGEVVTADICMGVMQTAACDTSGCTMYFSYLVNPSNTAYWSGLALTNLSTKTAGSALLTFTDSAGGTATQTVTLAANAMEVMLFNSSWLAGLTGSTLDASKNMKLKITTTNVVAEGQLMIGGADPTAGIYGYFPRNSCFENVSGGWTTMTSAAGY